MSIGATILFLLMAARQPVNGDWQGTFHGQPQDATNQETANKFRMHLREEGKKVVGTFEIAGSRLGLQSIQHGSIIEGRACFDVMPDDGDDMRFCVVAHRNTLDGAWNRGPQAGPALAGLGIGVRLFDVHATRVRRTNQPKDFTIKP
jgi:hypothetical protein